MQAAMMQLPCTAAASLSVCIIAAQRSTAVELFLSVSLVVQQKGAAEEQLVPGGGGQGNTRLVSVTVIAPA
jgi:hypothetical protein